LSLAEASARSGLSVGTLKVASHRALRTRRIRLESRKNEPADGGGAG
jgi:DNA-directed RNA polymerase specialized sigma24 family protein